ncbi:MAG: MerR family transcriptional regulator [Bacteriovoracaceae bacterium]|jgi:DNA-binding transcriptional MerR regulator|nr:hypothetical protein [Halobacteriovoraceae bacterium]MDP7320453.1 MerR family transcriptional regulator [Bacteriovoracaceae bacterium]|tara:strand:- start:1210 stop:1683 length:474 start_codon:yes stop_codon:yes gene_type:complete
MNFEDHSNKTEYKFNEVTSLTAVKPYVLRFWESEFDQINPITLDSGQKIYSKSDIESIEKIKKLLFESKMSIQEVKAVFEKESQKNIDEEALAHYGQVQTHNSSLEMMKSILGKDITQAQKTKSFNDSDVLHLVQAKKKLNKLLGKIEAVIVKNKWE